MDGILNHATTYAADNCTTQDFDLNLCIDLMRRFKVENDLRAKRMRQSLMDCVCPECGRGVGYELNPERFVMCHCMKEFLRVKFEDKNPVMQPRGVELSLKFYGVEIEVSPLAPLSMLSEKPK